MTKKRFGKFVMVDIETAGLPPDGVILSIGATRFDVREPFGSRIDNDAFYRVISYHDQIKSRTVSIDTMDWWYEQDTKIHEDAFAGSTSLEAALKEFAQWLDERSFSSIWANGVNFDLGILNHAYMNTNGAPPLPWEHWQECCLRPIRALAEVHGGYSYNKFKKKWFKDHAKTVACSDPSLLPPTRSLEPMAAHNALGDACMQASYLCWIWEKIRFIEPDEGVKDV